MAGGELVDALAQRGVGGDGEVEAVTQTMRVDALKSAFGVDQRPARGSSGQRRRVLDAAGDPPAAGAAELPVDAADDTEGDAQAVTTAGSGEHHPAAGGYLRRPLGGGGPGRVDPDDDEVSVGVGAEHLGLRRAPVGEGDLGGAVTQVVGVGEDPTVGDHHPAAPAIAPDGDGRGPDAVGDRRHRPLQFIERWHLHSCH